MANIPEFSSDAEAAEFWQQHSLRDFEAELEPAAVAFSRGHKHVISMHQDAMDPADLPQGEQRRE